MPHLRPELTKIEEMLIARVHVLIIRNPSAGWGQYKYKGHVAIILLAKYAQNIRDITPPQAWGKRPTPPTFLIHGVNLGPLW